MATESTDNDNTIISRMQVRRGLKQDLPQPLRPGEIGLATDSRQVYIGNDPDNPNSTDFNAVSFFENTVNAREHTVSIANNQIIAFTVPFVKYSKGEFNGITTVKQWQATDARSIINGTTSPECVHTSSIYPIFSNTVTQTVSTTVSSFNAPTQIAVNQVGNDITGNIRVGDRANVETSLVSPAFVEANVTAVSVESGTGNYIITLDTGVTTIPGKNVTITLNSLTNFLTGKAFVSSDVIVNKNGCELIPEANATIIDRPTAAYDYVLDATDTLVGADHTLTLRTRPSTSEEITVSYYGNAAVIQALGGVEGLNGKISPYVDIDDFYTAYNIPEYRQIPDENIRVSTTTGLGFIGLQQKHITSVAEGANIASPGAITLGNLIVSRNDIVYNASSFTANANVELYDVTLTTLEANVFTEVGDGGIYRYNRALVRNTANSQVYLHNNPFDVVNVANTVITIRLPEKDFAISRTCTANLASGYSSNGFTDANATQTVVTLKGESEGVRINDYVRVFSAAGNTELHDTVFQVINVREDEIDVRVEANNILAGNTVPDFTANIAGISYVNHGSNTSQVNVSIQMFADDHDLTAQVSNIRIKSASDAFVANALYAIDNTSANLTSNTFFVTNFTQMPQATQLGITGTYVPELASSFTNMTITPVLSIDLRANTSLSQAVTTVNKSLVETKAGGDLEEIFPLLDYVPQDDGSKNRVYLTQDPAYSSVSVGGLEFSIFEDQDTPTLSVFGFIEGEYNRENNTVRAKLEKWMNELVIDRDINLFSTVLLGSDPYQIFPYIESDPNSKFYNQLIQDNMGRYYLTINDTFGEIDFCSRQEARDFNYVTNSAYSESIFDRSEDGQNGTRGLVNLKNNIEIFTKEAATSGQKTTTYTSMETATIKTSDTSTTEIFSVDASRYNSYLVEYSIATVGTTTSKYSRIGTMQLATLSDFTDTPNAAILTDTFTSRYETSLPDPIVEPSFTANLVDERLVITMVNQLAGNTTVTYNLGETLRLKYVVRRWSSTE